MNPGYATLPPFQYQTFNTSSISYYNLNGHIQLDEPKQEAEIPAPNDVIPEPSAIPPPDIALEVRPAQPDPVDPAIDGNLPPLDVLPLEDGLSLDLGPVADEGSPDVQVKDFAENKAVRKTKGQKFVEAAKAAQIARLEKDREAKAMKADRDKIEKEQKRKLAEKTRKEKALKQAAKLEKANRKKVYGSTKKSTNSKAANNEAEPQDAADEGEAGTIESQDPAAADETPQDNSNPAEGGDLVDSSEAIPESNPEALATEVCEETETSTEAVEEAKDALPLEQLEPEIAAAVIVTESTTEGEEQSHANDEPIRTDGDNEAMPSIETKDAQEPNENEAGQNSEIPLLANTEPPVDEVVPPVPEIVDAQPESIPREVILAVEDSQGDNPDAPVIVEAANDGGATPTALEDTLLETQPPSGDAQAGPTEENQAPINQEIPSDTVPEAAASVEVIAQGQAAAGEPLVDSSTPVLTCEQVLDDAETAAVADIVDEQAASVDVPESQEILDEAILGDEQPADNEIVSDTIQPLEEEVNVGDQAGETVPLPSVGEAQIEESTPEEAAILEDEQITDPSSETPNVDEETTAQAEPIAPVIAVDEISDPEPAQEEVFVATEQTEPPPAAETVGESAEQSPPIESEETNNSDPTPSEPEPAPAEPEFIFKMPVKYASYKDDPEISDFVKNAIAAALAARAAGIPLSQIPLNGEPFVEPPPPVDDPNEGESSGSSSDTVVPETKVHVEDDLIAKMAQVLGINEDESVKSEADLDTMGDATEGGADAPDSPNDIEGEPGSEQPLPEESASQPAEPPPEVPIEATSEPVAEPQPHEIDPVLEEVLIDADPAVEAKPQNIDPALEEALVDAETTVEPITIAPETTVLAEEEAILTDEPVAIPDAPVTGMPEADVVDEAQEAKLEPIEENISSETRESEPPKQEDETEAVSPVEGARDSNGDAPPSPEDIPGATEPGAAPKQKRRRRRVDGSERRASNSSVPAQPTPVITSQRRPSKPEAVRTNSVFGNLFGFSKPVQSTQSRSPVETQPVIVRERVRRRRSSQSESERPKSMRVDSFEPVSPVIVEDQADSPVSTKSARREIEGETRHESRRQRRSTYRVVDTENKEDTPPRPKTAEEEEARRQRREARRAAKEVAEEPRRRSDSDGKDRDRERKDRSTRTEKEDRAGTRTVQSQRQNHVDAASSGRKGLFSNLKKLVTSSS